MTQQKTADMLWYLARIIKSYFQDGWTNAYHEKYILFTSLKFQLNTKSSLFDDPC